VKAGEIASASPVEAKWRGRLGVIVAGVSGRGDGAGDVVLAAGDGGGDEAPKSGDVDEGAVAAAAAAAAAARVSGSCEGLRRHHAV